MRRHLGIAAGLALTTGCFSTFGGGQSGEEDIGCLPVSDTELADGEDSVLGFGGAELTSLANGGHDATLSWETGEETALALDVSFIGPARFLDLEWQDSDGDLAETQEDACADVVARRATVVVSTADGALNELFTLDLTASSADRADFYVPLDLENLEGTLVIDPGAFDGVTAWVNGSFETSGTTGVIEAQGTSSTGEGDDDTTSATSIPVASWR